MGYATADVVDELRLFDAVLCPLGVKMKLVRAPLLRPGNGDQIRTYSAAVVDFIGYPFRRKNENDGAVRQTARADAEVDLGTTRGLQPRRSSQRQPAGYGARSRPDPAGRRAPDVFVFLRHTGQHRRRDWS
jgi:hypothetical protein